MKGINYANFYILNEIKLKQGGKLTLARRALYVQSFPIFRKQKSNYTNFKINRSVHYFDINYSIVPMAAKNCIQNSEILKE